jgi:two-component system, NarL family, sensor histidine kinase UhpB
MNSGSIAIVRAQRMAEIVELPVEDAGTDSEAIRIKRDLAREIHDQVAQHLTAILMQSQVFIREQEGRSEVVDQLAYIESSVREVLNNVRQILCDLRGQPGLAHAFVEVVRGDLIPKYQLRTGVGVILTVARSWPASLPPDTAIHLYRIIQEALTNAHRHGGAKRVHIALRTTPRQLVVSIRDDGRGIDWLDEAEPVGVGILGMRERAALLRGDIAIDNRPPAGITVTVSFPKELMAWPQKQVRSGS